MSIPYSLETYSFPRLSIVTSGNDGLVQVRDDDDNDDEDDEDENDDDDRDSDVDDDNDEDDDKACVDDG